MKMFNYFKRTVIGAILALSLIANAALVVSETAYNLMYGILSNVVSILYEGAELSSSVGWKKQKLNEQVDKFKKEISQSLDENKKLVKLFDDLEVNAQSLRKETDQLGDVIRKKQIEISELKKSEVNVTKRLEKKILELDDLKVKYELMGSRYSEVASRVEDLKLTNKKINTDLMNTKKSVEVLKINLNTSKTLNSELSNEIVKNGSKIEILNKQTARQIDNIKITKNLVQEATDKVSKRIAARVSRNLVAMPFESIPVAGIAITVGTIFLEIQDACTTMSEFNGLASKLGFGEQDEKKSFCTLSKDDLERLILDKQNTYEDCMGGNSSEIAIDELFNCLPEKEDLPGISDPDDLDLPSRAEL